MYGRMIYVLLLLLCFSVSLYTQESQPASESPSQKKIEMGISVYYYNPDLDEINKGYAQREYDSGLQRWNDFKISYLVLPSVIYHIDYKNQVALQFGGSYMKRDRTDSKSYYYVGMIGGEYRYVPMWWSKYSAELCVMGGAGVITSKFYRSYGNDIAINASATNFYINAGAALRVDVTNRIGVNLDLKYLFVPDKKIDNLDSDLSLKSFLAGIGVFYSL